MKREIVFLCAAWAVAATLVGCNKEEEIVDPYVEATLREATYGEVVSDEFLYKIANPTVVDGLGDILVVKQGNLTEFFTGNGIAGKVDSLKSKEDLTFRVLKRFSPVVHFQVHNIVSAQDSVVIPQEKPIAFPRTQDAMSFTPPDDYASVDMTAFRWNDTESLRAMIGKKYAFRARLSYGLEQVRPDSTAYTWMLEGYEPSAWGQIPRLRLHTPRPSLEIVLRLLLETKQDFVGGVTYADIEPWDYRRKNHVCGTADIGFVRYLDQVFTR
jgi:hypothetical protein